MWGSIAISLSSGFSAPVQPQIETSGSIFHLIYIPFHSLFSALQINSPLHPATLDWFGLAPNWVGSVILVSVGSQAGRRWGSLYELLRSQRGWGSGLSPPRASRGPAAACALDEGSEGSSSSSSSSRGGRAPRAGPTEPCSLAERRSISCQVLMHCAQY